MHTLAELRTHSHTHSQFFFGFHYMSLFRSAIPRHLLLVLCLRSIFHLLFLAPIYSLPSWDVQHFEWAKKGTSYCRFSLLHDIKFQSMKHCLRNTHKFTECTTQQQPLRRRRTRMALNLVTTAIAVYISFFAFVSLSFCWENLAITNRNLLSWCVCVWECNFNAIMNLLFIPNTSLAHSLPFSLVCRFGF